MTIKEILAWIKDYKEIYITGHIHPDGDCVGAALGLQGLLAHYQVDAKIILENPPQTYDFLEDYSDILQENPEKVDVLFVVDCNSPSRFAPFLESYKKAKVVINIDHHELPDELITDKHWIVPKASSTCELIYNLIPDKSIITSKIASALYTGIIFDTGGFVHSNTTGATMRAAAELVDTGINFGFMMKRLFQRQTEKKLAAKKIALDHFHFLGDKKIAVTYITHQEFIENELAKEDTEDIVHMIVQLENIEAAVFACEFNEGIYKLSFRSKNQLDVCEIAKGFNGGGHKKAAGASSTLPLDEILLKVEKDIIAQL